MSTPAQDAPTRDATNALAGRTSQMSLTKPQMPNARAGPSSYSRYSSKAGGTVRPGSNRQRSQQYARPQPISEHEEAMLLSLDQATDAVTWVNASLESDDHVIAIGEQSSAVNGHMEATSSTGSEPQSRARRKRLLALDARLAGLSTSLAMAQQDTLAQMDANMADIAANVPRLGLDLRLMADAAKTLKSKIHQLSETIEHTGLARQEEDGSALSSADSAVETLSRLAELSTLQARMIAARDVLSLAESWSTLSSDVSAFLLDGRYDAAAMRLAQARSSLAVFERTPEYEKRKDLLEDLGDGLQSKLAPIVEEALRNKDMQSLQKSADTLEKVERKDAFASIWRRDRVSKCTARWEEAKTVEERIASSGVNQPITDEVSVVDLLKNTLDDLALMTRTEGQFTQQVFKNSSSEMEALIEEVIKALRPSLRDRVMQVVPFYEHEAIVHLDTIHRVLRNFDVNASAALSALGCNEIGNRSAISQSSPHNLISTKGEDSTAQHYPFPAAAPSQTSSHAVNKKTSRRTSSLSMNKAPSSSGTTLAPESTDGGKANSPSPLEVIDGTTPLRDRWTAILAQSPDPRSWQRALFAPMTELQCSYEQLERAHMIVTFERSSPFQSLREARSAASIGRLDDRLGQALRGAVAQASALVNAAAQRTRTFTYGCGYAGLLRCADEVFEVLFAQEKESFDAIAQAVNLVANQRAKERLESGTGKIDDPYIGNGAVEGQQDEWKAFEDGMGLLAALRECMLNLEKAEHAIISEVRDFASVFLASSDEASEALNRLYKQSSDGSSSASFRMLLEASEVRLRDSDKDEALTRIYALDKPQDRQGARAAVSLLENARTALLEQLKSLQSHQSNLALASIMPLLEFYPQHTIWDASRLPGAVNEYDLTMPSFSLSPTEQMSRIGESLLDLPRLLEVWSESRDAQWGVQGLPYVGAQAHQTIVPVKAAFEPYSGVHPRDGSASDAAQVTSPAREKRMSLQRMATEQSSTMPHLDRKVSATHRHTSSVSLIAAVPASASNTADALLPTQSAASSRSNDSALQSYLSSICLTLVSHVVSLVLPSIARLSTPGASQLAADLDYLVTILAALNVAETSAATNAEDDGAAPSPTKDEGIMLIRTLEAWRDVCKLKDADGRRLRHLVRTGQVARGGNLAPTAKAASEEDKTTTPQPVAEGFTGSEDKLRSLLGTEAFDMVSRMRGWVK